MEASSFAHLNKTPIAVSSAASLRSLNAQFPDRYPFLLQSSASGGQLGRYDILFVDPGESLVMPSIGRLLGARGAGQTRFLDALSEWWRTEHNHVCDAELPFSGGWFVYLGYELAAEIEPRLNLHADDLLPVAFAVRCRNALIFDHETNDGLFVSEDNADRIFATLHEDLQGVASPVSSSSVAADAIEEDPGDVFVNAVKTAKRHISAGDVYQANLSREWQVQLPAGTPPENVYQSLCDANPAPFAGIARWGDTHIISSSPERLVSVRDGVAATRPIAGTRPRNNDSELDRTLSKELFAHPKERAEHIMLIDLERNDLGRVCEAGSVVVDEMMVLESYAHVHHIVSNVRGRLRPEVSPGEVISAVFPGGTITGCPKVRCMEIIAELEATARGAYTGSFGYLNRNGDMDLNILIRTMVQRGSTLTLRAGAGIVADSDPDSELHETRAKAKGMLRALHDGEQH